MGGGAQGAEPFEDGPLSGPQRDETFLRVNQGRLVGAGRRQVGPPAFRLLELGLEAFQLGAAGVAGGLEGLAASLEGRGEARAPAQQIVNAGHLPGEALGLGGAASAFGDQRREGAEGRGEGSEFGKERFAARRPTGEILLPGLGGAQAFAQPGLFLGELLAQIGLAPRQLLVAVAQGIQALDLGADSGQRLHAGVDRLAPGEQRLSAGDAGAQPGQILLAPRQVGAAFGQQALHVLAPFGASLQEAQAFRGGALLIARPGIARLDLRGMALGSPDLLLPEGDLLRLLAQVADTPLESLELIVKGPGALPGARLQRGVLAQIEDIGQHLLALGGGAGGKLIGAALEQERGVDEGLVRHMQQSVDLLLRFTHAVLADGAPAFAILREQIELALAGVWPPRLPTPPRWRARRTR